MRSTINAVTVAVALFAFAVPSGAQDFGTEWMDRVTHETVEDSDQLTAKPVEYKATAGVLYYHDDNIYLESSDENDDSIVVPFGGLRLDYAEPQFDAALDALVNYNSYSDEDDASGDEERVFARGRYVTSGLSVEVSQLLRFESSPNSSTLIDRTERMVSDTVPLVMVDLTDIIRLEARYQHSIVDFDDDRYDALDNTSFRAGGTLVYEGFDGPALLADAGVLGIEYENTGAPADSDGFYARGGLRGDLTEQVSGNVLLGYTSIEADDHPTTGAEGSEHSTADADVGLTFTGIEKLALTADYARRFGFGSEAAFQTINSVLFRGDYEVNEKLKVNARLQFDNLSDSNGRDREYVAYGFGATYPVYENVTADAGVLLRSGDSSGFTTDSDYDNTIFHVGVAASF